MRLLLDTHIFLWYITADPKLPASFRAAIQDPANEVFLSVVSVWEAVIKHHLGKLPLPAPPASYLPIHRDPFDRLLIAQALQHGLTIATVDPDVLTYPIPLLTAAAE